MAAAAAIAAGTIGAAYIGSRATGNATKAQLRANDQAMAYTREQDAKVEGERARAREERLQAVRDWYATYGEEGIKRWGPPKGISLAELRSGTGKQVSTGGHGGGAGGVTVTRKSPTIADLMTARGSIQANGAMASGDVMGRGFIDAGQQFADALKPKPAKPQTFADIESYGGGSYA
jgi:hypothetical protein